MREFWEQALHSGGEHFIARTTGLSSSAKEIIQKCRAAAVMLVWEERSLEGWVNLIGFSFSKKFLAFGVFERDCSKLGLHLD